MTERVTGASSEMASKVIIEVGRLMKRVSIRWGDAVQEDSSANTAYL
jgi:hypothetical protein